jgi:hypothetical protein
MRTVLFGLFLLATGLAAGCESSSSRIVSYGGEAGAMPPALVNLHVLPVELPDTIHGNIKEEDIARYRRDWPMAAARVIAHAITEESDERVRAVPAQSKPEVGHYFRVEITYLDVGDLEARAAGFFGGNREGWSLVLARGKLYDAAKDELVAEFEFTESSGHAFSIRFENDMYNLGEELALWLTPYDR